ncbi:MAG TPA: right-handed parallel beta-helix repeat-containing protein [Bryobacteraceae bacterium]|nr:right-handed parallel beta-helix repeat-containing protein [Bryobacteraceae bacterium]
MNLLKTPCIYLTLAIASAAYAGQTYFVDDDGRQCAGAFRTIQEAVAKARMGDTILVCPGTYSKTVLIKGHDKDAIRLIAISHAEEVVLQGDHMEVDGFHLEDVDNVLLRGFTVRDFGMGPTVQLPNGNIQSGMGNGILLLNANYNVIENNQITRNDMMGIFLVDSAGNTVRFNRTWENDSGGSSCGIMLFGPKAKANFINQNVAYRNGLAGLMMVDSGSGNLVIDNDFVGNGQWGIENRNTPGTWIEGNRVRSASGRVGELVKVANPAFCATGPCGLGIHVRTSTSVTVIDNFISRTPNLDILWDGTGQIRFEANSCQTSSHPGLCGLP